MEWYILLLAKVSNHRYKRNNTLHSTNRKNFKLDLKIQYIWNFIRCSDLSSHFHLSVIKNALYRKGISSKWNNIRVWKANLNKCLQVFQLKLQFIENNICLKMIALPNGKVKHSSKLINYKNEIRRRLNVFIIKMFEPLKFSCYKFPSTQFELVSIRH